MKIDSTNYFSQEANNAYWSASLIKDFMDCEARALASLRGEYERPSSTALLVGSYVDAHFEGTESMTKFVENHPEIIKRDGTLKAEYVKADEMIERAESDPVFTEYLTGEKQVIRTGEIFGFPFKIKMDVYQPGKRIVDLKTVRDFAPIYKPGEGRLSFAQAWNWPLQMAIYQAVEGNRLPCYLAVITKEDPPDIEVIQIPQETLDAELEYLKFKLPRFDAIKQGVIEPKRCGSCAYCRGSKRLTGPRSLAEFEEVKE